MQNTSESDRKDILKQLLKQMDRDELEQMIKNMDLPEEVKAKMLQELRNIPGKLKVLFESSYLFNLIFFTI